MAESEIDIVFREANGADGEAVRDVVFPTLREYGLEPSPGSTDADLFDLDGFYRNRGGFFEVVEVGGGLVGCAGLLPMGNGSVELRKMYLLPGARGRGIGKRLLERMIGKAGEMGFKRIVLETASPLKEAISLYESFGFKPIDEVHTSRCDRAYFLDLE